MEYTGAKRTFGGIEVPGRKMSGLNDENSADDILGRRNADISCSFDAIFADRLEGRQLWPVSLNCDGLTATEGLLLMRGPSRETLSKYLRE